MTPLTAFIAGVIVGATIGALIMACLVLARRCDDQDGQP
jgi:hypothetical protein